MSYQLVIAEKPSVARSIAGVIGADKKQDGYMEGNGYLVSWCIGHLVSLADAGTYVCTIFIEAATSDTIQLVAIPVMPILEATLLAVGACLLATAIPLRKISKMSIVDSIETVE